MSENVANRDAQRAIDRTFNDFARGQDHVNVRLESSGVEHRAYRELSAVDNSNNSYGNTIGRDPRYGSYEPRDIDAYAGPEYGMSHNYYRTQEQRPGQ
jgi:hypothetical protein